MEVEIKAGDEGKGTSWSCATAWVGGTGIAVARRVGGRVGTRSGAALFAELSITSGTR